MKIILTLTGLAISVLFVTTRADAQNYKIRQTVSMNGQKMESTTYVKGPRKRTEGGGFMGMGGDVATVEQCDLKRDLKISDKKRMYTVEPYDNNAEPAAAPGPRAPAAKTRNTPTTRGGTVTYISNISDTGERKQMFGMTARHIKTSMSMEASPDACTKQNMRMESDGWYIDLPEFSCPVTFRPQVPPGPAGSSGGCRDDIKMRSTGGGKPGFALSETRTMSMGDAGMSFAISTETLEFSKATLDSALFDIPQGYSLTDNSQNLYGRPDVSAMMKSAGVGDDMDDASKRTAPANNPVGSYPSNMSGAKRPGTVRIGVYAPTNRSGDNVSISNLQSFLVQQLSSGNVEAIAIGSEPDARSANCDYVLSSDFSKLKQSTAGKIGGMFGKVTNTSVSGNYDAQVDYKLVSLSNGQTVLTNKAASKSETDVDRAAEGVLSQEAQSVIGQVRKN